jgi:hypothetical protein
MEACVDLNAGGSVAVQGRGSGADVGARSACRVSRRRCRIVASPTSTGQSGVGLRVAIGVPGPSLGNPPVVVFSLGLGGVPKGGPVAGQLSGTLCAGLTHLRQDPGENGRRIEHFIGENEHLY